MNHSKERGEKCGKEDSKDRERKMRNYVCMFISSAKYAQRGDAPAH
jgi:hypothetical protein